ncbi:asparagine synthase (glutamine-hydrolyzing) [Candidatus Amarobacter glycogenicus]|uniref:asparagine synthase (glutamine-hydrolyzing) n=1 Tax=Candidatus Amarobacter glycogenicus TaxID=3140699 RepID=UPI003136B22F|nr:asparagine synthase (glutamine-hydrolyzing) [Dehalococcoidia bacterium]
MCGISGILRAGGEPVPPGLIDAMIATLRHRGPDGEGSYFAPGIAFGHTRLAIIDLSAASDQPFIDDEAGLALSFNGEIYNYIELRDELRSLGQQFRSTGDTEVLLRAYQQWGPGCLPRLNGMFAFALWDNRKRTLLLGRDRFGEKPLYIARSPKGLVFASEMKAILAVRPELREANRKAMYRYLSRGDLDLDHESFFDGIESLPGGHYLLLDHEGRGEPRRYWEPTACEVPGNRAHAIERFREILFDSIRIRLRSDVPVGSSLSGGIDSSSIVSTINAQKTVQWLHQKTFSARFHSKAHDEGKFIKVVTHRVEAETHEVWVEPEQFIDAFERLQYHQEEPMASASPFAQWLVMQLARENDTTVLLDGQGADEILAGYDQAHGMFLAHWLRRGRLDKVGRELSAYGRRYRGIREPALYAAYYSLPGTLRDGLVERYYRSSKVVSEELHREFAPGHVDGPSPFPDRLRNELVRWQTTTQLPEFLRYADRNSMAFSREVRLPFLDHRLAEYAFGLPPDLLLKGATTKVVLRESMRGIVPDGILDRKDKLAYAPPQHQWNHGPLRAWILGKLQNAVRRGEFFNPETVREITAKFDSGGDDTLAWRIASAEAWFETMVERPALAAAAPAEISPISW